MVFVRVHRHAIEVLAKTPVQPQLSRQEIESAIVDDGTGTVKVHRHAVEILGKVPLTAKLSRQEIESAVVDDGTGEVRVHRHALEVLFKAPAKCALSRQEIEAAFADVGTGASVRVHRMGIEILARVGVPPPTPLSFPTGLDFFLHNWVESVSLQTRYMTDITRSPTTLAEDRTVLLQRPQRQVTALFSHEGKDEVDRLMHTLRRLTTRNLVLPLYPATVVLDASSTGQDRVNGDFRYRRYFNGARVAVFPARPTSKSVMLASEVDIYLIESVLAGQLQLDRNLDQTYAQGEWMIVPLIDLEIVLRPEILQHTDSIAQTSITLREVVGKSALPPSFTGNNVDGWRFQLGLPVFEIKPDWAKGITTAYRRYGQRRVEGRKPVVSPLGPRYVQVQDFDLKLDRPDFWRVLNMFDSRRGRGDLFWEIDQEFLWTVSDTDPTFIDVAPRGVFADFEAGFTDHAGIVMNDGTIYIREINTIQDLGSWRLTLVGGNNLPDPIDVSQIERFSRARMKRFDADVLKELWHTTEVVEMGFSTIEVLAEEEIII